MNMHYKHVIPSLLAVFVTASVALAQTPPAKGPRGANRTPPTAEQMAARQTQMCADRQAAADARFTFIEERLKLTAAQKPLFQNWKAAQQSEQAARQANCGKPRTPNANGQRPTLPERNARMEAALKDRLASLEKIRPSEEALYNALTAEQKKLFETRGGRGGPRMGMNNRGRGFGGPGFRGRGPGGRGPGGRGPGGNPTAAPAAQ
jgi:hypothetical protein